VLEVAPNERFVYAWRGGQVIGHHEAAKHVREKAQQQQYEQQQ
jgi:hypothetical protein